MSEQMPVEDPIVRPKNVHKVISISKSTVNRLRRKHRFPEPIALSDGAVGWRKSTLDAWLKAREEESTPA